jgi:putative hydrolase of the HAD superfamily
MRAMLLDALGTLVDLDPPVPRLRAALGRRGVTVTEAEAAAAVRAEIGYYRAHLGEGRDAEGLAALRRRCALVLRDALPPAARPADEDGALEVLAEVFRFTAFPEVPAALRELRAAGWRLVVASNWDVSLHEALAATGLSALVDGAVSSAEAGAAKPDGAIFSAALALAGADAGVHAGDSVRADVAGALAAGLEPVLVARPGAVPDAPVPDGIRVVRDLAELAAAYA